MELTRSVSHVFMLVLLGLFYGCHCDDTTQQQLPAIVFSSHERTDSWVFTTLTSLLLVSVEENVKPEIHIMVGGVDSHYLDNVKHHSNVYIHPLTGVEQGVWARKERNWRGGWNYVRCLNMTRQTAAGRSQGVIIVEDDVVFANHFWSTFQAQRKRILSDLTPSTTAEYVLDLYARFSKAPKDKNRLYTQKVRSFCCTQCMYYTPQAADAIQHELRTNLKRVTHWGYDMSVKHVLQRKELPMFNSYPALAQHIGIHSSIGSFGFHRSKHFRLDTPHAFYHPRTGAISYNQTATKKLVQEKLRKLNHQI